MAYYNMTINNKNNNQTIMWQKGNKKNRGSILKFV